VKVLKIYKKGALFEYSLAFPTVVRLQVQIGKESGKFSRLHSLRAGCDHKFVT